MNLTIVEFKVTRLITALRSTEYMNLTIVEFKVYNHTVLWYNN